jgi:signal transduction histidine kinase
MCTFHIYAQNLINPIIAIQSKRSVGLAIAWSLNMLRSLRWKLTLAFLGATLGMILLIGGGAYLDLQNYFQTNVDLSLMHSMAGQFHLFGNSLPEKLVEAEVAWVQQSGVSVGFAESPAEQEHEIEESLQHEILEGEYSADIAAIFVMPLNSEGKVLFNPNSYPLPMEPYPDAAQAALSLGNDLRTVTLTSGTRVRLLTFRTEQGTEPALLQLGRLLIDQDRALSQLAVGIAWVGSIILVLAGAGSWWLAGRTLVPAQQAWDQQQAFVANASHELRTPLTLMRASTEVALRGNLAKKERDLLNDVLNESDYMSRLVDDLLLLSRLDAGRLKLEITNVPIKRLFSDIKRQAEKMEHGMRINVEVKSPAGSVKGDVARLRQVLLILLDNAIKHTSSETAVRVFSQQYGKVVEIIVEDQGPGIPAAHLPHLFQRFYQVPGRSGHATHSYGLGLSIAKRLIEQQNGKIRVESHLGSGTKFTISLPAAVQ